LSFVSISFLVLRMLHFLFFRMLFENGFVALQNRGDKKVLAGTS